MDIFSLYRQYGISYATEGDRHTTRGWVNCRCPFCTGSPGFHLGFHLANRFFRCWRCGWHSTIDTLVALCQVTDYQARQLYHELDTSYQEPRQRRPTSHLVRLSRYRRPVDVGRLRPSHQRYLEGRGFDPDKIEAQWHVLSTGPAAYLDNIDYRHRLFIPIMWDGREVSFQTRDVTGKSELKYKACPMSREAFHHKHLLYGCQEHWQDRVGIAVEGVTDVWKLGVKAFAVLGIAFKTEQVVVIQKLFDRVVIVFDGDNQAQKQAHKLCRRLEPAGVDCSIYKLGRDVDPGSLSQNDADHLVRETLKCGKWS